MTLVEALPDPLRSAVIVGTSVAGVRAAQALRRSGYPGPITLIGAEHALPYDKPPLSKALLAGTSTEDSIVLLNHEQATSLGLTLRLGDAAVRLDVAERQVRLASGAAIDYDDLVIATGARARPSPWPAPSGVHVLRSIDDCRNLRADLSAGGHIVVVGAGFIGSEVSSTGRALGHPVTLVDPAPVPMARLLGPQLGDRMARLHHRHGVTTHFGAGVDGIAGQQGALTVSLTDGTELHCATAVVGIGAQPNVEWLNDSGLLINDGVICDEFGRASAPGVYFLGDVARWHHPRRHRTTRAEHWTNAVDQARCIARTITSPGTETGTETGTGTAHDPIEFVWSDQYDWKLHIIGEPAAATQELTVDILGKSDKFATVFATEDGDACGAAVVNWPKASITLRRVLAQNSTLDDAIAAVQALATTQ